MVRSSVRRLVSSVFSDSLYSAAVSSVIHKPFFVANFTSLSLVDLSVPAPSPVPQNGFTFTHPLPSLSTMAGTILVQDRDLGKLDEEIQNAINKRCYIDIWKLFKQHMQIEGFPRKSVVNRILTSFAESLDVQWLERAYGMVEQAFEESKQNLLEYEPLLYLSLCLANCGLSVLASTILRKLVETEQFPPVAAWSSILGHMSLTASGAYVGAELVLEIGYLFQDQRVDPRKKSNAPLIAMKPNAVAFSIALAGCLLFGTTRKAEQLLDMMPRVCIKADANLLIVIAQIYAKNGRREDLKKLHRHIDEAFNITEIQFGQFYNCLITCHLKFGDLDSVSSMVLEMLRKAKEARNSLATASLVVDTTGNHCKFDMGKASGQCPNHRETGCLEESNSGKKQFITYQEFCGDRNYVNLAVEAKEVLDTLLAKLQTRVELVTTKSGILQPTDEIYVKLVKFFLETGRIKDLVEFLIKVEKEDSPVSNDDSVLVHVINLCISLGWLDQAHDLLDEMRFAGVRTGSAVYASLLKAYCEAKRVRDITALLRDAQRDGIQLDSSCYDMLIQHRVLQNDTQGAVHLFKERKEAKIPRGGNREFEMMVKECENDGDAGLMAKLMREIKEGQKLDSGVHDWNNVIHFFCKKRLMPDAEKALKKMRSLGHTPNAQTFHSMVTGYAAVGGKYTEVKEVWGEMKGIASRTSMEFDQELLDSVLYTFVRGGFFVRANEVVNLMENGDMFIDKYKYRTLFLKYHKTLCKAKAPKFQTEKQLMKREAALTFRKWVGLY